MPEYSPAHWWRLKGSFLKLEGTNCPDCHIFHFPPRPVCPEPNCPSKETLIDKQNGEIFQSGPDPIITDSS